MALDIGTLKINVDVDDKQLKDLQSGLEKGAKQFGDFTSSVIDSVKAQAEFGDSIDKGSQKMQMSAESYQIWSNILEHSGTSLQSLKTAMKQLPQNISKNSDAVKKLGIDFDRFNNLGTEDQINLLVSSLQNVSGEEERAALAQQLLGRQYQEFMPLLNTSNEDMQAMIDTMRESGSIMSDEDVKSAAAYEDALTDMNQAMNGIKNDVMSAFLPALQKIADVVSSVITWFNNLSEPMRTTIEIVALVVAGMVALAPAISAVTTAITIMNSTALLPVIGIVAAVVAGIAAVIVIIKNWGAITDWFKGVFTKLGDGIKTVWSNIKNFFIEGFKFCKIKIEDFVEKIKSLPSKFLEWGKNMGQNLWDGLKGWFDTITTKIKNLFSSKEEVDTKVSGSHRSGISYIPQDGYIAELHRGEMVLTQAQAEDYIQGTSSTPAVYNTYNITVPKNENALETAITLRNLTRKEAYGLA